MPITKTVNKTSVNGSEVFIYNFNVSFSELVEPTAVGKLVDFFPDKIIYQLPPLGGQLISIDEFSVPGGTRVEFNFGNVNAGTSINFTMACEFGFGRVNNDTFTNEADLYADDVIIDSATAETVNLTLDEDFVLFKLSNISGAVVPGQEILFKLLIQNNGDYGARIDNVVIQDILPPQLIPVLSFTPVGNSIAGQGYPDTTYDGKTGTWTGSTLNFTLPSFSGSAYSIDFKATVAQNVIPGETITNTATWSVNGVARPDGKATFKVFEETVSTSFSKNAPKYAEIGGPIQYSVRASNNGTVELINYVITDNLPDEVDITEISFISNTNIVSSYDLFVETSESPGIFKSVATNLTGNSGIYDVTSFIPPGQRVTSVRAVLASLTKEFTAAVLWMKGTVNSTATPNQVITNFATATAESSLGPISANNSANTTLNGKSILKIEKSIISQVSSYFPLDELSIRQQTSTDKGQIINPIFIDLLPLGLDYVPGKDFFLYSNAMEGETYDSRDPGFPIMTPAPEIIKDYEGTGRTLVRFDFSGFTLLFGDRLTANFGAIVTLNPPSTFVNYSYLGNPGDNTEVDGTPYLDTNDLDGDGITNEQIAQSNVVSGVILTTSEFSIEKFVKGDLEDSFSKDSTVTSGGDIVYKIAVTNNQEMELKNIELVDILPYVGDTGVILINDSRGSQFNVYATEVVSAEIVNVLGDPVLPPPIINIEYSTSNDPIRFDENGTGTIGTGTWSSTPPEDITTLASIRITTDPSVILKPYERLIVTINAKAPVDTPINKKAYNSFAVQADKVIGNTVEPLLPVEPNKVSVQIKSNILGSIGDFVWNDFNANGIHDAGEPGVNGIGVELYDDNGVFIKSTVTANNGAGDPGFYAFNNLKAGIYSVKFVPTADYELTIQNLVDPNGSKPDPATGFTEDIILGENEIITDIDAGLISDKPFGSIGDFVWDDLDGDGVHDPGEPGVNGVTVNLYSSSGVLVGSTVTANNGMAVPGFYAFNNLPADDYVVEFIPPIGYDITIQNLVDPNGSRPDPATGRTETITLAANATISDIDAGLISDPLGSIGNFVWNDLNGNGRRDIGEPGVNGVTVELYSSSGALVGTTVTADNEFLAPGFYAFNNLAAGEYVVKFIPPTSYDLTIQDTGVSNGSKPDPTTGLTNTITLASDVTITDIDAGVISAESRASIGDFVWDDLNGNGIHDPGEPGVNGVTVNLYSSSGALIGTTVTANNGMAVPGFYAFNNLAAGEYVVEFIPPIGYELTIQNLVDPNGSKPDPATGRTEFITLGADETISDIDAGVISTEPRGSIGDFVWDDLNGNGIHDPGEPGVNGVTVNLYSSSGALVGTTVTANNGMAVPGFYAFNNLAAGEYVVEFIPPIGYELTIQNLVDPNGSRPDPATGRTETITLSADETISDIDAGLIPSICQEPPVINAENQCIPQGSIFDPLANATATDCDGSDIPLDTTNVIANNVNTAIPGLYQVTYEVTSPTNGLKDTKTIYVRVFPVGPRYQSITDIIESVALEETSLAHILNAEGEKIQKAVALNLSQADMIRINDSVESMTEAITKLEMVLESKISLFKDCICGHKCEFPEQ